MLILIPAGITLAEALLSAATSALIGYGAKCAYDRLTDSDTTKLNRARAQGEQRAKAEYEEKLQRIKQAIQAAAADNNAFFNVILAIMTVGYAYAAARDGKVSSAIRTEVSEFVIGQSHCHLPLHLQQRLNEVAANPPDLSTARQCVLSLSPDSLETCDLLIAILQANPSTSRTAQVHAFAAALEQLKYAA